MIWADRRLDALAYHLRDVQEAGRQRIPVLIPPVRSPFPGHRAERVDVLRVRAAVIGRPYPYAVAAYSRRADSVLLTVVRSVRSRMAASLIVIRCAHASCAARHRDAYAARWTAFGQTRIPSPLLHACLSGLRDARLTTDKASERPCFIARFLFSLSYSAEIRRSHISRPSMSLLCLASSVGKVMDSLEAAKDPRSPAEPRPLQLNAHVDGLLDAAATQRGNADQSPDIRVQAH